MINVDIANHEYGMFRLVVTKVDLPSSAKEILKVAPYIRGQYGVVDSYEEQMRVVVTTQDGQEVEVAPSVEITSEVDGVASRFETGEMVVDVCLELFHEGYKPVRVRVEYFRWVVAPDEPDRFAKKTYRLPLGQVDWEEVARKEAEGDIPF